MIFDKKSVILIKKQVFFCFSKKMSIFADEYFS